MSVSSLSKTLQSKILSKILENVRADISTAQAKNLGSVMFGTKTIAGTITQQNVTRLLADEKQTGVFSQTSLNDLAASYNNATSELLKKSRLFESQKLSKKPSLKNVVGYLNTNFKDNLDTGLSDLANKAKSLFESDTVYNEFLSYIKSIPQYADIEDQSGVFFLPEGKHATINKEFEKFLIRQGTPLYLVEFISATTDAGHLLGIFNQKLFRAFKPGLATEAFNLGELVIDISQGLTDISESDIKSLERLNKTISAAFNLIEYIDFLSSSLKTRPELFVKLSKEVYKNNGEPVSAAEIQISFLNSDVGRALNSAGRALSDLLKSAETVSYTQDSPQRPRPESILFDTKLEAVFKKIGTVAETAKQIAAGIDTSENKLLDEWTKRVLKDSDAFADILLNAEGSDSVLTSISKSIVLTISGKKLPSTSVSKVSAKKPSDLVKPVNKKTVPKPKAITKTANVVTSNLAKGLAQVKRRRTLALTSNLVSLQNLLNGLLVEQVKRNMGTGNSRSVLNLRTGRFAESVKVERLSESRAGMITAFYSYMRNPYATFSQGGRQQNPASRDPKLLIARSIREIAQQQVQNRLRAVNV